MSTENTQTDVTSSGDSAESVSTTAGQEAVNTPVKDFAGLQKAAKDSADADSGKFKAKSVDEALKETAPVVPATPAFTPNFKYKAALQEKEIEEFWRPLIKDADSEKRVKEALSRLDGFDFVKQSRDEIKQQMESLNNDYQAQTQVVKRVEGALQRGDLSSAFRQLGLNDEAIFRYTQERLQRMEMPPEQRKAFEEAEQLKTQQEFLQEQMSQYQAMYETQAVQTRTMQLDYVLSRPEVATASHSWDTLQGQPGAFRDLVIQEAQNAYYQTGRDLSAEQATQLVMQKFGKVLSSQQGLQQSSAQQMPTTPPTMSAPQAKPVIPNVSGKGAAPIKKVPKSIEDLKRMGKELEALENQSNY